MRLVYLALGWVSGLILAASFPAPQPLIWLAVIFVALLALLPLWRRGRWLAFALLMCGLGGLRFAAVPTTDAVAEFSNRGGLTLTGVIIDEPDYRDDRVQFRLAVETITRIGQTTPIDGRVLVQASRRTDVRYGDRVAATGFLITPAEIDTFSYRDYLARSGVFSIMPNAAVQLESRGHGFAPLAFLIDLKTQMRATIGQALPEPQAGLLTGILLGNERGIAPEVADAFNAVGAAHVIAISGFNMAILSGVIARVLGRLLPGRRRLAAALGIGLIAVYTIFVGANAAVVRAAVMSSLLVIAGAIRRRTFVPASLAFVVLIMALLDPTVLWDVGFQLSFFAVLGLTLFTDPLLRGFERGLARLLPPTAVTSVRTALAEPLIVSLAAQITTLPLVALYFHRWSPLTLPVNLLIVPVQPALLMIGGVAALTSLVVPALAQIIFWIDLVLLAWTTSVVRLFARLPFASAEIYIHPNLIAAFFITLIGGALLQATQPTIWLRLTRLLRSRPLISAASFGGVVLGLLIGALIASRPDGRLHVWLLNMGHSNAVLVQSPGGAQMLVDGGRFPARLLTAIGDRLPFNDRTIEVLALTQPDARQYGAVPTLLSRYDVGVVLTHGQDNLSPAYDQLLGSLSRFAMVEVRAGYTLDFDDGLRVEVLHPQTRPVLEDPLDDHALVLRLTYGQVSFLLTSDLSSAGQRALIDAGEWPAAAVMQLPQHGGERSLDDVFLQAAAPQVLLLQSDPANRFGDPDPDTLAQVSDLPLFRTDLDRSAQRTVHLWTDGRDLWVGQDG
ncbi:MAG: DUF4131 domain-containing protein [Chloroflexi bacterium]|nr:DUF4131 domain-containing protein [Chloroflexota bacterium]